MMKCSKGLLNVKKNKVEGKIMNKALKLALLVVLCLVVSAAVFTAFGEEEAVEQAEYIGSRIEMMVDEALIESYENLQFVLNQPEQVGVAITTDKPWEGKGSFVYGSVIEFEGKYYLYYRANQNSSGLDTDPGQYLCLAISEDGVNWIKPELDIVPYGEYEKTNILMSGETSGVICHNFTPCIDTNPDCPPDERIKAVAGYEPDGLFVFVSADGIHFRKELYPYWASSLMAAILMEGVE